MSALPDGLHGHLELLCALDDRGWSSLQRQSFRAPFHVSKPHRDAGALVVNVANPTAGFLTGDRATCTVEVASGASLVLTTPAANRALRMRHGGSAELQQAFHVARGGWLEYWPEPFIPQAGTRFRQRTELRVEAGGEALFFELLAPGRTASGETFAYAELRWETDVWAGGRLAARERYTLRPEGMAVQAVRVQFANWYYASCFVLTDRLSANDPCWKGIDALHSADVWIGSSALVRGGWVIKILASSSLLLRRQCGALRLLLHEALGRVMPDLRRTSPIE